MKFLLPFVFTLICSLTVYSQVTAENPDSLVVITMTNGEVRIGQILNDDGREILLLSKEVGKIYIRKENIKNIVPYKKEDFQIIDGEFRGAGPFTTRYYFTTNSLPIKKGENYAMLHLYGPEVHFALSNRFSLGVMSTWGASPFILALKYTIPTKNEKLNFGVGTLMGTSGYLNTFRGFGGLHWGMVTYGDRLNNITLSAGFSYIQTGINQNNTLYVSGTYPAIEDSWSPGIFNFAYPPENTSISTMNSVGTAPVLGLGGIAKVGKKASFIFDAMVFFGQQKVKEYDQQIDNVFDPVSGQPAYTLVHEETYTSQTEKSTIAIFMPGMRFQTKDTRAFQLALAGVVYQKKGEVTAFPIPMVSWFFKF